jgi:hypothetical protein
MQAMKRALMKVVGWALCFCISGGVGSASDFNSLQEFVRKSFTSEYAGFLVTNINGVHVEVCGDTCSYFEWSGNSDDERYWRFITLFELSDGPGTDVEAFLKNVKALKVDDLVDKKFCAGKSGDLSKLACNWQAYAESLHVRVGRSRYDEGRRCYAYIVDLKSMTSSDWKCSPMRADQSPFK